ncbi:unnamed protein product [Hydatigera taeniaeformis]|uniref:Asparaginase domain-containing protein n=1 Tax=Hydatigena taeniaeformis TaxID=6205 RepID=A0A0R3WYM8_HYDTA|nr:unnamed protein product [Hydatigera taeniaeformis]
MSALLRGNRVVKRSATDLDAFTSPNYPLLAEMSIDVNFHLANILHYPGESKNLVVIDSLCRNVIMLRIFPSITTETVKALFKPPIEGLLVSPRWSYLIFSPIKLSLQTGRYSPFL